MFNFEILKTQGAARLGLLTTPHGTVETPAFIFCATKGSLKTLSLAQIREAGVSFMLGNTYHLMLSPGHALVARQGGLHRFMGGWDGPLLTDSGGFQIFSLGHGGVAAEIKGNRSSKKTQSFVKITEEGAIFRSYIDGAKHFLTPEHSIEVQVGLGADFVVVLDECTPFHVDKDYTQRSMYLSHRWAQRSCAAFQGRADPAQQALYGIVQGGIYEDLRRESVDFVNHMPFFGHAVGGSLGQDKAQMDAVVSYTAARLDPQRPRHLLGIGGVRDIFQGVHAGMDTFDCVHPTRIARHGGALIQPHYFEDAGEDFHRREHINLNKACFREDPRPLDARCPCPTCQTYSRAYLHHLLRNGELLALSALTLHNVSFMVRLMQEIRAGLQAQDLEVVRQRWVS